MASDERRRGEIYLPVLCDEQNDMASRVTGSVSDIGGPRSGRDMFSSFSFGQSEGNECFSPSHRAVRA